MKKKLLFSLMLSILCILIFGAVNASAATYGDFTYEISDGEVSITGCDTNASGELFIPDTIDGYPVTSIRNTAFAGCRNIEIVNIPSSVNTIAKTAFLYECDSLKAINVDEANEAYSSDMGVLFDKKKTRLIRFPAGCVEAVDEGMYIMPNTVTVISQEAFSNCKTVELLWIYGALKKIEMAAFMSFDTLQEIWFDGTQYNWDMVEKGICNEKLDEITVLPIVGEPKDEFNAKVGVTYYLEEILDLKGNESILENLVVSSSDTNVAVVDKEKITAIAEGTAIITAVVTRDGMVYAASVKINVTEYDSCIKEFSLELVQDDNIDLNDALGVPEEYRDNLIWISTNDNIVSVINSKVKAINPGEAIVVASLDNLNPVNFCIICKITVEKKYTDESYFEFSNGLIKKYIGFDNNVIIPTTISGTKVTSIGANAFMDCSHIIKVEIPETINRIESQAFVKCTALEKIIFSKNVTLIGDSAFDSCSNLNTVIYNGTKTDWNNIIIGNHNYEFINARRYYCCYYVTILSQNNVEISKKQYNAYDFIEISDIGNKIGYKIQLYTDKEYKNEFDMSTKITKNLTLYLKYVPTQYTYKFVDENGNLISEKTADYGTKIVAPSSPSKPATQQYTYTFTGWEGYTDGMTIEKDITFTAKYTSTINKYTYKFVDANGNVISENTVDYGTTITMPDAQPQKPATQQYSYTFAGWDGYTDGMTIENDITFTPKYTATVNKYTYTFYDENGGVIAQDCCDTIDG